jgi:hypothetical protein
MAFGATLTITINAVAKVLNRINQDNYGSEFYLRETLVSYRYKIRHSKVKATAAVPYAQDRHNVELTVTTFATSTVPQHVSTYYSVIQVPEDAVMATESLQAQGFGSYSFNATRVDDLLAWLN